ncbi:hypothetical protein VTN96DRAFT_10426 [Rasamsonia emersonii]
MWIVSDNRSSEWSHLEKLNGLSACSAFHMLPGQSCVCLARIFHGERDMDRLRPSWPWPHLHAVLPYRVNLELV